MEKLPLSIDEIERLFDKFSQSGITSFEMSCDDFEISFAREQERVVVASSETKETAGVLRESATAVTAIETTQPQEAAVQGTVAKAPIVGTFYCAPAPDKDPFVTVGKSVKKGDVLYIIESMKLMNEVTSEVDGVVAEIYVKDGQGVEYGEAVMRIQ